MADSSTTAQKISAEALGTFVLVFFGCGTAIFSGGDYVAIGLAFGLTVLAGAYAFGRISGAHFNPAISVGAALGGRMAWRQVPLYVGSQLVGRRGRRPGALHPGPGHRRLRRRRLGAGPEQLRRRRHRLRRVGGVPGRDHPDRDLRLRDPRRHRRPQRAPGAGAGRDRPDPHDDPLRVDQPHRHLGQPGPLHRRRHLRRQRRDHPALAVHPRAAGRRCDRGLHLPAALRPRHRPGPRLGADLRAGPRRPRCPATARPTSSSRSGTSSRPPRTRRRGSRSRSSRTAGSGTTPRRSGSRWSSGRRRHRRPRRLRLRPPLRHPAPTPAPAPAQPTPPQPTPPAQQPPQPDPGTETTQLRPPE